MLAVKESGFFKTRSLILLGGIYLASIAEKVFELVKPNAEELGLTLWEVKFLKEGASYYLRILLLLIIVFHLIILSATHLKVPVYVCQQIHLIKY